MAGGTEQNRCEIVGGDLHRLRHGCLLGALFHHSSLHLQALTCKRSRERLQAVSLQGAAHVADIIIIVLGHCNCRVASIEGWLGGTLRTSTFIEEYTLTEAFGTAFSYMVASNEIMSFATLSALQGSLTTILLCLL